MRISLFIGLVIILILVGIGLTRDTSPSRVCTSQTCINVELADTEQERAQGLMFRETLANNEGMLFVFPTEGAHTFWMKNTRIPLDMMWIDREYRIVHIEHAVPCVNDSCAHYTSPFPARYVLEVNANFTTLHNLSIGDKVELK